MLIHKDALSMYRPVIRYLLLLLCIVTTNLFAASAKKVANVRTSTVTEKPWQSQIEAIGTLQANEFVTITASVTESITAIYFDDGEYVKKNQILVEMSSAEEQALLKEAKTNKKEAKNQLDRVKALVNQGSASESLLDERQRNFDAANARLVATQSRLQDRTILAPFNGRLGLRNISVGALVKPGDVITTLTDNSRMKLDFNVPAVFIANLVKGLPIIATTSAYPTQKFHGTVVSIDNQIDPVTRSIKVRAILPNDESRLKQGMLMSIEVLFKQRKALIIPEEAVVPQADKNYTLVIKNTNNVLTAEKRMITLGERRIGEVEVLQGLQSGEEIITHGAFKVRPGTAVKRLTQ